MSHIVNNTGSFRLVREYCQRYQGMPNLSLARLIVKENPGTFSTVELARSAVRYCRGKKGSHHRKTNPVIEPAPPSRLNPFDDLPPALRHFDDWRSYELSGKMRVGILSDIHIPYHAEGALRTALHYLVDYRPTHLILNGDTCDFFTVSFWEKDPRERNFPAERQAVVQFLRLLRKTFPKTQIIFKDGNHEERYARYMRVRAPELLGLDELELEKLLCLDELGIARVKDKRPILLGEHLYIVHGHEFSFGITSPVNPARGFYMKSKVNCIGGHLHRTSEHSEKTLSDKVVSCWSTGSLCDPHPDYSPINAWNHGFATVDLEADSSFVVKNCKIIGGKVF